VLNPAPATGPLPPHWLPLIDYLIPNELEAATLTGLPVGTPDEAAAAAAALRKAGARNVIITLGAQGVLAALDDAAPAHFAAPRVAAVDTTAAGDAFNGALAVAVTEGRELAAALRFASAAAAITCTRRGAQASLPTREEVERLAR